MRKIYTGLALCLLVCNVSFADVQVWKLKQAPEVYPVANDYETSHNVGKCSSQRTKRRAHMYSSHNLHKKLDNEMINACYVTCQTIAAAGADNSAREAMSCVDTCRTQEREQRQDGKEGIQNVVNTLGTGALLLKLL